MAGIHILKHRFYAKIKSKYKKLCVHSQKNIFKQFMVQNECIGKWLIFENFTLLLHITEAMGKIVISDKRILVTQVSGPVY